MLKLSLKSSILVLLLLFCLIGTAHSGEEPQTYDRVTLSANAAMEVENDTLIAILYYQREGAALAPLANEVNKKITDAVKTGKRFHGVDIQTPAYRSSPVYEKQRLVGWRVRQTIRLKSQDIAQVSNLIGELQKTLALESVSYSVSPDKLQDTEEKLIAQAIDAFKKRSLLITHQFDRSTYRLVNMSVNTGGAPIRPLRMQAAAVSMEAAAPTLETGKQNIQVNVTGTIELQLN